MSSVWGVEGCASILKKMLQDGSIKKLVVTKDEGPRAGTTRESLGKLKPVSWPEYVPVWSDRTSTLVSSCKFGCHTGIAHSLLRLSRLVAALQRGTVVK